MVEYVKLCELYLMVVSDSPRVAMVNYQIIKGTGKKNYSCHLLVTDVLTLQT